MYVKIRKKVTEESLKRKPIAIKNADNAKKKNNKYMPRAPALGIPSINENKNSG